MVFYSINKLESYLKHRAVKCAAGVSLIPCFQTDGVSVGRSGDGEPVLLLCPPFSLMLSSVCLMKVILVMSRPDWSMKPNHS